MARGAATCPVKAVKAWTTAAGFSEGASMDVLQGYVRDADMFRDHAGAASFRCEKRPYWANRSGSAAGVSFWSLPLHVTSGQIGMFAEKTCDVQGRRLFRRRPGST
jgi:hypothetical protein